MYEQKVRLLRIIIIINKKKLIFEDIYETFISLQIKIMKLKKKLIDSK